ncbi:MAG: zinc-binding dehydrogenase, partial [Rhizobiales bacterium]|nr:zinc-binding dehydrogenase [Hyphomicrobiales bacterium]
AVGTAAIQHGKRAGLTVIGSAGSEQGLALVRGLGADLAVDHNAEGYVEQVREASAGGPQMIIEMLANVNLATDLDLVAKYGRVVIIGARAEVSINPRVMMMKELDVRGLALFNATRAQGEAIMDDLIAGLADGSLNPIIGTEMPLEDVAAAYVRVMDTGAYGKLVLTV